MKLAPVVHSKSLSNLNVNTASSLIAPGTNSSIIIVSIAVEPSCKATFSSTVIAVSLSTISATVYVPSVTSESIALTLTVALPSPSAIKGKLSVYSPSTGVNSTYTLLLVLSMNSLPKSSSLHSALVKVSSISCLLVSWKSSNTRVIGLDGKVTRYVFDRYVDVEALIHSGDMIGSVQFWFKVEALDISKMTEEEIV